MNFTNKLIFPLAGANLQLIFILTTIILHLFLFNFILFSKTLVFKGLYSTLFLNFIYSISGIRAFLMKTGFFGTIWGRNSKEFLSNYFEFYCFAGSFYPGNLVYLFDLMSYLALKRWFLSSNHRFFFLILL